MHTWVRRGLQTALVTGGLLMLGTGIASANENVNPDQPPSPVDAGVSVPTNIGQNAIGTPVGEFKAPGFNRTIGTGDLTGSQSGGPAPEGLSTDALPTRALPTRALPVGQVAAQANPLIRRAHPALQGLGGPDLFRGNKLDADIVVPVDICGNAVAAGGDAYEDGMCGQDITRPDPITTDGDHQTLAGNVVATNGAIPVQVTGNAVSIVGDAFARSISGQSANTGGDIRTSGEGGTLSGTVGAIQWATPVQVANNAVAGGGNAGVSSASESDATSTGSLRTSGKNSTGGGTVAGVPVAVPFQVDGNGLSGIGNAGSQSQSTSNATAGSANANNIGLWGHPTWILTDGDPSTGAGNVVQPQVSGPVSVDDNAGGAISNTSASSVNNSTDSAGGLSSTTGNGSTGSGNFVDAPVALPTGAGGNGVTGIGNAATSHTNNINSTAGGDTLTNGDNSVLSANSANVPPAGQIGVCGDSAGGAGSSSGTCDSNVSAASGGYNGTTGNNAAVSGNMGQVPVAFPVSGSGAAVSGVGNSTSSMTGTGNTSSGGTPNTNDDNGTLTSNVVSTPTALPAQVFGDAISAAGNSGVTQDEDTTTTAGGPAKATGHDATGAGNIVFVPSSAPTQVFGDTDTLVGNGSTVTDNASQSTAGGDATSNGDGGSVSGNVAQISAQPVDDVFGEAGDAVGIGGADTDNTLDSQAGGDTRTSGDYGSLAGNAVGVPATVSDPVLGDAIAAGSKTYGNGTNDASENSGGQLTSSGVHGTGSGNVAQLPVESDPDVFGDAVAAAGQGTGVADNNLVLTNGGDSFTRGGGALDAYNFNEPLGVNADVIDTPVPVLGDARTITENNTVVNNGYDTAAQDSTMALPGGFGGRLGYGAITPDAPRLPTDSVLSHVPSAPFGAVPAAPAAPGVSTQDAPATPGLPSARGLPSAPGVPMLPTLPSVSALQGLTSQAGHLPVDRATTMSRSALGGVGSFGDAGSGMAGVSGISGVLPVLPGVFPRV